MRPATATMRWCRPGRPTASLKSGTTIDRPGLAALAALLDATGIVFDSSSWPRSIAHGANAVASTTIWARYTGRAIGTRDGTPARPSRPSQQRLARARRRAQGGELRPGRRGQFARRLRGVFLRLLLFG